MKKLTEKDAIWYKTQKQAKRIGKLLNDCYNHTLKTSGYNAVMEGYEKYGNELCVVTLDNPQGKLVCFADREFYKNKKDYTIHKAKDILKKSKIKELEKRVSKLENIVSDNTTISKMESVEPLKFDLPTKELEELPEKWCMLCTEENAKILNKYLHENKEKYRLYNNFWIVDAGGYFVSENQNGGHTIAYEHPKDYTEITFDQFKKWVLKQETEIDCGKPGQLVCGKDDELLLLFTNGNHEKDTFQATILIPRNIEPGIKDYKGEHWLKWSKEAFKLCTEPITLKNE